MIQKLADISDVRERFRACLLKMRAISEEVVVHQSFLVSKKNEYMGVRFVAGPFQALWVFGQPSIDITRDGAKLTEFSAESAPVVSREVTERAA